jgi:hypothetical protein
MNDLWPNLAQLERVYRLLTAEVQGWPPKNIENLARRVRAGHGHQRKESAVAFLEAGVAYYAKIGIRIERVMTDNGSCYLSLSETQIRTYW